MNYGICIVIGLTVCIILLLIIMTVLILDYRR